MELRLDKRKLISCIMHIVFEFWTYKIIVIYLIWIIFCFHMRNCFLHIKYFKYCKSTSSWIPTLKFLYCKFIWNIQISIKLYIQISYLVANLMETLKNRFFNLSVHIFSINLIFLKKASVPIARQGYIAVIVFKKMPLALKNKYILSKKT